MTFQKLSHFCGGEVQHFLLERGDKPEKGGGGGDVENDVEYLSDLQSFELTMQDSHPNL